jgi:aspartate racemase
VEYERLINQAVRKSLGGSNSADLILRSFNFAHIAELQRQGKWDELGELLAQAARDMERAGAKAVVICANTMHLLADHVQSQISVPLINVADATGTAIKSHGLNKVLLVGTKYTMEKDFYRVRLAEKFDIEAVIPNQEQRDEIHRIIYDELVRGVISVGSKTYLLDLIEDSRVSGVEGVIAGCTEIELLVKPEDLTVPYFPTAAIHSAAIAEFALS